MESKQGVLRLEDQESEEEVEENLSSKQNADCRFPFSGLQLFQATKMYKRGSELLRGCWRKQVDCRKSLKLLSHPMLLIAE